ncbi:unnamed protein product [Mytilus coruscus]|uniref:Uncharacterized protein n=1 Tax=Mytilus coruscus TaxID=42192 RepID=A0A6J8DXP6_MYTCO|nr:unnamed protein product [Mytilus coruscus]
MKIWDYIKENQVWVSKSLPSSAKQYINQYLNTSQMEQDGPSRTEIELHTASLLLQTNIFVYCKSGVHWTWKKYSPFNSTVHHGIYLYMDRNKFDVVVAVENSKFPPNLNKNEYYYQDPKKTAMINTRKRKQEQITNLNNKRYKLDDQFRHTQQQKTSDKYKLDAQYRSRQMHMQKQKYAFDASYALKKKTICKVAILKL